jgi:4-amino-4-deoxy-L-arabinose transferase-like glycosyltransferase
MRTLLLGAIIIFALGLRIFQIGINPPSLSWDEVSIGYNAYSILKTGSDEHGKFLPWDSFVAYGDYKPPLSVYLTVPFVALFGLTEIAVRLPVALFGTLTVLVTYALVLELFGKKRESLALLSSFLLTISPWHINLSRAGFEAVIAHFFVVLGIWMVLRARTVSWFWTVAWLPFVASIYTFNSARYFSFIFALGLVVFCFREIQKNFKIVLVGFVISLMAMAPIMGHLLSKEARLRFAEVNIFTDKNIIENSNMRIDQEGGSILSKIIHNRRVGYARSYILHFMDNLEPRFLFVEGDGNPKFSIRDIGQLYPFEAPFLAIGILMLFVSMPAQAGLLLFWIIASIMPAAVARETPHALRILNSLPSWQIFVGFGIMWTYQFIAQRYRKLAAGLLVLIYMGGVLYYMHNYYAHYPQEFSGEWQYGYREAIRLVKPIQDKYSAIQISDSIGRPYMYTLFYTQTNPQELFSTKKSYFDAAGFYHVDSFGKYHFGGSLPGVLDANTLYIWDAGVVPSGSSRVIHTVKLLNGNPVLTIFDAGGVEL